MDIDPLLLPPDFLTVPIFALLSSRYNVLDNSQNIVSLYIIWQ